MKNFFEENERALYTPESIFNRFDFEGGEIPEHALKKFVKAISLLPHDIIDYAINYCSFIGEISENSSYWDFDIGYLKGKNGIIILNSNLWSRKDICINFLIAHEMAHAINRDKHIFDSWGPEKRADRLAIKWLSKHYKKEDLLKQANYLKLKN
jgi:hypothetical protein